MGPPSSSTLQWLQALRDSALWPMDPPPRARPAAVDETISEADHWRMTMAARHALTTPPALEPALEWVLKVANMWRHDLRRIRRGVVQELKIMVDDMEDTTKEWLARRPFPVRSTFSAPDRDRPTQVPLLLHLLPGRRLPRREVPRRRPCRRLRHARRDQARAGLEAQRRRQVLQPGHHAGAQVGEPALPAQEASHSQARRPLRRPPGRARRGAPFGPGHRPGPGPGGLADQDRGTAPHQGHDDARRAAGPRHLRRGVLPHHPGR